MSQAERRARSAKRFGRQHMKSLSKKDMKRKREQEAEDQILDASSSSSTVLMPTPRSFTSAGAKDKKNKKKSSGDGTITRNNDITTIPTPDFSTLLPFVRCHWSGPAGVDPPDEALKSLRKSIGVKIRGNLLLCPSPILDIHDANLPVAFGKAFAQLGLSKPSPIQSQCWPAALAGANVLSIAPTGSGKTLAYTLPMLPHIEARQRSPLSPSFVPSPFALVLVPTRELAIQVSASMKPLKRSLSTSLRSVAIYGGNDKDAQVGELKAGDLHVVVATPGRLLDLIADKKLCLMRVSYLVIDEADRMLAMGFQEQLENVSRLIRSDRQTLLFTATFPGNHQWADPTYNPLLLTVW